VTKVGVIGAAGKMGSLACTTIEQADGLDLVARVDERDALSDLTDAGVEVAVDYTHPGVVMDHISWCVDHGIHLVVGTSGFTDERLADVERELGSDPSVAVLVVPNFSIGAVLMMRFAAEAARFFESAEIVELHHPTKKDAPSGTSIRTAQLIAAARAEAGLEPMPDATVDNPVGARGGTVEGVPVHSVRARGLVAHQEVILGNLGETLTIRHDMPDRIAAMPALVTAVQAVLDMRGLVVGLERVLGLPD
jgi:4-hydroxy-tetrahydrodipicolinate reductase